MPTLLLSIPQEDLILAYQVMAADEEWEREALEWSDGLIEN